MRKKKKKKKKRSKIAPVRGMDSFRDYLQISVELKVNVSGITAAP